jgi:multisubunit Na+/H+ antiporter MnhG subunit
MAEAPDRRNVRVLHEAQINNALGTFLVFFGTVVLASILLTDTGIGKLTNLGAGAIIAGIGAAMICKARRLKRSQG